MKKRKLTLGQMVQRGLLTPAEFWRLVRGLLK